MDQDAYQSLKAGTAGGAIFTFVMNIHSQDILKTAVLAGIGATVSFATSLLLNQLVKWYKHKIAKKH